MESADEKNLRQCVGKCRLGDMWSEGTKRAMIQSALRLSAGLFWISHNHAGSRQRRVTNSK